MSRLLEKKELSKKEQRWIDFFLSFPMNIQYVPGARNMADALSRREDHAQSTQGAPAEPNIAAMSELSTGGLSFKRSDYVADPEWKAVMTRIENPNNQQDTLHQRYVWDSEQEVLFLTTGDRWRIVVPRGQWRKQLLHEYHDVLISGMHVGRDRMIQRLSRLFFWRGMYQDVKEFVKRCVKCQQNKPMNLKSPGLLQPMPVPAQPWEDIGMDLITDLPATPRGWDAICTFVCRLSKMVVLVPTTKTITAEGCVELYFNNVVKRFGLCRTIVCDRDPRFVAEFFTRLFKMLGSSVRPGSAYHPARDGQVERAHKTLEEALRSYVGFNQDDWDTLLPMAEFGMNSSVNASTGSSPFLVVQGYHPRSPIDAAGEEMLRGTPGASSDWIQVRRGVIQRTRDEMIAAQNRQLTVADRSHRLVSYKVGDWVWVAASNLMSPEERARPKKKLKAVWTGPFKILEVPGPTTVKLELPSTYRANPAFHVDVIKPFHGDPEEALRKTPPQSIVDKEGNVRFVVESIKRHRGKKNNRQFLVKWVGYEEPTWEPEANLRNDVDHDDIEALRLYKKRRGLE